MEKVIQTMLIATVLTMSIALVVLSVNQIKFYKKLKTLENRIWRMEFREERWKEAAKTVINQNKEDEFTIFIKDLTKQVLKADEDLSPQKIGILMEGFKIMRDKKEGNSCTIY